MIKTIKGLILKKGDHKTIAKRSLVVFFFSLGAAFIGYLSRIMMTRVLTPAEYGLFFSIFTLIAFFIFTKDLGLTHAVAKYIPQFKVEKNEDKIKTSISLLIGVQVFNSLVLCIILWFMTPYLTEHYYKNPAAGWLLPLMLLYIMSSVIVKFYKAIFQGNQKMGLFAIIEPIKNGTVLVALLFFGSTYGLHAVAWGFILSCVLVGISLFPFLIKLIPTKTKIIETWPTFKMLCVFGFPAILGAMGGEIISYFDTIVMTYYNSLTTVGIYNVVLPTATTILLLCRSAAVTIYPMISERWAQKKYTQVQHGIKLFYKLSIFLIFPLIISWILAKPFLGLFFGEEYIPGTFPLQILFTGTMIYFIGMINYNCLAGVGHPKENAKIILSAAVINIILNFVLIPKFEMIGAAIATTIAYLWVSIYSTIRVRKLILKFVP